MNNEKNDISNRKAIVFEQDEKQEFKPIGKDDAHEFDEKELFCRMAADENIFNSRGLAHAPKMTDNSQRRYHQMGCCAQMHSYQWTDLFSSLSNESDFPVVQVRFKNTHKDFFRLPENESPQNFQTGDIVVVESANGHDTGVICLKGELVRLQLKKRGIAQDAPEMKKIYRKARQTDMEKWTETIQAEKEMQRRARVIAAQLGLSMKINNVEIQGDFTKAIFYYTADDRVDFRQLIKLYADEFKLRIEMRQIGARQESGILGGIGACGRELCCVTFLHNFTSVGTQTARIQQVSLNPQKLAGQCSKLKCCLNFEYEVYQDAMKTMPDQKTPLKTEKGEARCVKVDPLRRRLTYAYDEIPGGYAELSAEQAFEIIEKNKRGEVAGDIREMTKSAKEPAKAEPEFQQVVGQDDLTRFDKPRDNNRNKNRDRDRRKNKSERNPRTEAPKPAENRKPSRPTIQKPILKNKNNQTPVSDENAR